MGLWEAVKHVIAVIAIMAVAGGIVYLLSGVIVNALGSGTFTSAIWLIGVGVP